MATSSSVIPSSPAPNALAGSYEPAALMPITSRVSSFELSFIFSLCSTVRGRRLWLLRRLTLRIYGTTVRASPKHMVEAKLGHRFSGEIESRGKERRCLVYGLVVQRRRRWEATRAKFWKDKRSDNVKRDIRNRRKLRRDGWTVVTVWECWTRKPAD